VAGYTAGSWSCTDGTLVGSSLTLDEGDTGVTCTINNDDQPGTVIINKIAVGGNDIFAFAVDIPGIGSSSIGTSGSPSGGIGSQTFPNLDAGSYSVSETSLPTNWNFTSLVCTDPDGGTTVSGQTATIDLDLGETVECTFTNTHLATRRTQGFWATHLAWTSDGQTLTSTIASVAPQLCSPIGDGPPGKNINTVARLMGGFWSSIAKKTNGTNRSALDQARMQLVQQLLGAILNHEVFDADDGGTISTGISAYCGSSRADMINAASALAGFNESGEYAPFPTGFVQGNANPQAAKSIANKAYWNVLP
jgi:hypothetical protein